MAVLVSSRQLIKSVVWVGIDKFGYSALYFVTTVVLARLLNPSDYGTVGMLAIFISISQMMAESGLGGALIRKQQPEPKDYSTLFTYNLGISVFIYVVIFFSAEFIADYYEKPIVENLIRVSSISIVLRGLSTVQQVRLSRELKFKQLSIIANVSLFIASSVSIVLAFLGWGVWSLILQQVIFNFLMSATLLLYVRQIPSLNFCKKSFMELFGFGGRTLGAGLINVFFNDVTTLMVAKNYSIIATGFYFQARRLLDFPISIFKAIVDIAGFPILSKLTDAQEFFKMSSRLTRGVMFVTFPVLVLLAASSDSIVFLLFGNKWMESAKMLSILSVGALPLVIELNLRNIIKSSGRADLLLSSEIWKKIFALGLLALAIRFDISFFLWGLVLINTISALVNVILVDRITMYKREQQFLDIFQIGLLSIASYIIMFVVQILFESGSPLRLTANILVMFGAYILLGHIFKYNEVAFVKSRLKSATKK